MKNQKNKKKQTIPKPPTLIDEKFPRQAEMLAAGIFHLRASGATKLEVMQLACYLLGIDHEHPYIPKLVSKIL